MKTSLRLLLSLLPQMAAMAASLVIGSFLVANCHAQDIPGIPLPANAEASDQKTGSILFFNYVISNATDPAAKNTEISFTNTNPVFSNDVLLRVYFVDEVGTSTSRFVDVVSLQTVSLLASDVVPGMRGYVVAVAINRNTLCPVKHNYFTGTAHIKRLSGHAAALPAVAIAAVAETPATCGGATTMLRFDGVAYNRVANSLALDNIPARLDGNNTLFILNRVSGNLTVGSGAALSTNFFGLCYDDAENVLSFSGSGGAQFVSSFSNAFPRLTPRFDFFIPSGRSGWMKVFNFPAVLEQGLMGAMLNFNPNVATETNAFTMGHNLTHRTLTAAASYTVPLTAPDLTMALTHNGSFTIGGTGNFVATVTNAGSAMSNFQNNDTIKAGITLPQNLTYTGFSGTDWDCSYEPDGRVVRCTTNAALGAGASAPPLTLTVNVGLGTPSGVNSLPVDAAVELQAQEINDANNRTTDLTTINCQAITVVGPATIPPATQGLPYSGATFTQTGTAGELIWSISAGALPSGLTLNATTGVLSGIPLLRGFFTFTVQVKDVSGCTGAQSFTIFVDESCARIEVGPVTLPDTFVGNLYRWVVTASGGAEPYTFTIGAGALPTGLTLAANGLLAGTVTAVGVYDFTVVATDANNCIGGRSYRVVISENDKLLYVPMSRPIRLLDTRPGQVGCDAPGAPVPGGTSRLQNARQSCNGVSIPRESVAITGHITTVESGGGYLTLFPGNISDADRPLAANVNYSPNEIVNNAFTVRLSEDGTFKIHPSTTTHVVVDVTGYYIPRNPIPTGGAYFHPLPKPVRLLDTRSGQTACQAPGVPISSNPVSLQVRGTCAGVTIPSSALAVVGNTTVLNSTGGYLTLYPSGTTRPLLSNSNFAAGQVVNASFTAKLNPDGFLSIYSSATADVVMDIVGYYSFSEVDENGPGLLFYPLPVPKRILETRSGFSSVCGSSSGQPVQAGTDNTLATHPCVASGISNQAQAIVGNATVITPQTDGYLTLWPHNATQPLAASSNFTAGQILNRHFMVGLENVQGRFKYFSSTTTHLVIDVSGYFVPELP